MKPSQLVNVITLLVAFGMAIGLALLLAAYVGVIS
jgi:hypothetical protein